MASGPRAKSMGKGTTECSRQSGAMMASASDRSPEFQRSSRKRRATSLIAGGGASGLGCAASGCGSIAFLHQASALGDVDDAAGRHVAEPLHGTGGGPAPGEVLGAPGGAPPKPKGRRSMLWGA